MAMSGQFLDQLQLVSFVAQENSQAAKTRQVYVQSGISGMLKWRIPHFLAVFHSYSRLEILTIADLRELSLELHRIAQVSARLSL
jgi:hypothetical protein